MKIGIDVGGTNTDAVLLDSSHILATHKALTSPDVSFGINQAIKAVLINADVSSDEIDSVMIGTTHFINALVARQSLSKVAIIRLCLPATQSIYPLCDWPQDLAQQFQSHIYMVRGGYEYDGRLISPLDEVQLEKVAKDIKAKGIQAVAITGVFAHVNADMEQRAAALIKHHHPGCAISISSEIGRLGLIERENATIINASLSALALKTINSFESALKEHGIRAPFYISQNDGTLMDKTQAAHYPVLTFASGATNSMRGAAYLSGKKDAIVADIGGTTTDVGMLINGFPREASLAIDIGGVRSNFPMPDVLSIGLGGGSLVQTHPQLTVGPRSVGYALLQRAQIFGGDSLTATDIAVAAGYVDLGDRSKVSHYDKSIVDAVLARIHDMLVHAIDAVKTSSQPMPLVLVGGGSLLFRGTLPGISELIVPNHAEVANALGAAIAQISGEYEQVFRYEDVPREQAMMLAKNKAINMAISKGADPQTIEITQVSEVALAYLAGGTTRLSVKAVGDLQCSK